MYVYFRRWRGVGTCTLSQGKDLALWKCYRNPRNTQEKRKKHEENGESVMSRRICSGRCGIWRLWKAEPFSQSGRLGGIKTMAQRQRDAGCFGLYTFTAPVCKCYVDSRTYLNFSLQRVTSDFLLSTIDIRIIFEFAGSLCTSVCHFKIRQTSRYVFCLDYQIDFKYLIICSLASSQMQFL